MRVFLDDRQGRAALGLLVGGLVVAAGAVLTWFEGQAAPEGAVAIDDAGSRILLFLGLALMAAGGVMVRPGPSRRWSRWILALAVLGFLAVLVNWIFVWTADVWRVTAPGPEPDRSALGLPLCLVGCLLAAVCAARVGRKSHAKTPGPP